MKGPQRGVAHWKVFPGCAVVFLLMFAGGCGPKVSPPDVVSEFEKAGPMKSEAEIAAAYGMTASHFVGLAALASSGIRPYGC